MAIQGTHIAVVGAGIGGLAAALALCRAGAEVTVLEQAETISEVGAGLQISPNGLVVLNALGLGAAVRRAGVKADAVILKDYRQSGEVMRLDLARYAPDLDYLFLHRADLIELLLSAARDAGADIRTAQTVTSVTPGRPAVVGLDKGQEITADLVIGADGLKSVIRPVLNGQDRAFFTGQVAWRAIRPNDTGRGSQVHVHMGPHRHLVSYPLRGGRDMNIVAVQERADWTADGWSERDDPETLRAAFGDFGNEARALLDGVTETHIWGLFRHPVAETWAAPGLALMGDAAHPTLPFLAQGANLALEDAWVLADCLANQDDLDTGVRLYQAARKPRAARVVAAATGNAWKYHLATPPIRFAAHRALSLAGRLFPAQSLGRFDWLYRFDVTGGAGQRSRSIQTGT